MVGGIRRVISSLPRRVKQLLAVFSDVLLVIVSVMFAFYLRLGFFVQVWPFEKSTFSPELASLYAILFIIPVFLFFGIYKTIFRFSSSYALALLLKAAIVYGLLYMTLFTFWGVPGVPRTIGLIQPIIFMLLVGLSRFLVRFWLGGIYLNIFKNRGKTKTLIYGAGEAGRQLEAAMRHSSEILPVGFIDDDPELLGSKINQLPVYNVSYLQRAKEQLNVAEVTLALPSISRKRRNQILNNLRGLGFIVRTLPTISDVVHGRVTVDDIKELSVDDILGREQVDPNYEMLSADIENKTALVTGAGGSIGSELCRQIINQRPDILIVFDHSEYLLYQILLELNLKKEKQNIETAIVPVLGSITDQIVIDRTFETYKPSIVYHAAAYKHVSLVQDNQFEGIKNNTFGTLIVAKAAIKSLSEKFVLVSTDKAVRPTNTMGASKRIAELLLQSLSTIQTTTLFSIVRFGNVLGSSGSVVPLFRSQIKSGGPVTVTHKDVTRYFMTASEAVLLVIQAGALRSNFPPEYNNAPVFLLDMGEPIKIFDLAKNMIELSGFKVYDPDSNEGDIEIKVIGLRPGEKLYEELLIGGSVAKTAHPKIRLGQEDFISWEKLEPQLDALEAAICKSDEKICSDLLKELVFEYTNKHD